MNQSALALPAGFEALAPFIDFWAVDTSAERAHRRDIADDAGRQAFYDTAIGLAPQALELLDRKPITELDASEKLLLKLVLSFGHVAMSVELLRDDEARHASYRPFMRITQTPADRLAG